MNFLIFLFICLIPLNDFVTKSNIEHIINTINIWWNATTSAGTSANLPLVTTRVKANESVEMVPYSTQVFLVFGLIFYFSDVYNI